MEKLENELFVRWQKGRPNFCPDGIIDSHIYSQSQRKLMFVLKEVNSSDSFDLKQFVKQGGRSQTWNNIARWIHGIQNLDRDIPWNEYASINSEISRIGLLGGIIAMNIKKSPGTYTTNVQELNKIAKEDAAFLNEQFQIYYHNENLRPDFIIACGVDVSDNFNTIIEIQETGQWKVTSHGINYYEYAPSKYFIKYIHPEARIADNFLVYPLIDCIKEILKNGA